jgi:hypothetical protein
MSSRIGGRKPFKLFGTSPESKDSSLSIEPSAFVEFWIL